MEQSEDRDKTPQRDDAFPEKPLEVEVTVTNSGNNGKSKKVNKTRPSKFKSIFTKATAHRNHPPENGSKSSKKPTKDRGDNKGQEFAIKPDDSVHPEGVKSDIKIPSVFLAGGVASVAVAKDENTRTNDEPSSTKYANPNPIIKPTPNRKESSRMERPTPEAAPRAIEKQEVRRKQVTISKGPTEEQIRRHHGRKMGRARSVSGSRPDEARNRDDGSNFKQGYTRMKQKNRQLLKLVEELHHNCDYYRKALRRKEGNQEKEKYSILKENESLSLENCKLGQEIDSWREKCQKMENKSIALTKVKFLTKENKSMLEDIEVLKSVICRLNKELAFYQDKLRVKFRNAPENVPTYSTSSGTDLEEDDGTREEREDSKDWLELPKRSLLPLLTAYDEVLAEKEEIIRDHELANDRFKARCLEITKENDELHKRISDNQQKECVSLEEWEVLRCNAVLVLEENDLLHDQVDNLKRKEEVLFSSFQDKAAKSKLIVTQLEAEIGRLKNSISDLESKCRQLSEENSNLQTNLHVRIPREKHESMVQEFKQAFEDLKSTYQSDRKSLCDKISSMDKERDRLVGEVTNFDTENTRLRGDLRECEDNLTASTLSLQKMKASMLEATSTRDATSTVMEDFMKHVEQLVSEKKQLLADLDQQKTLNEKIMTLRSRENELVAELRGKLEAMDSLHNDEIRRFQQHIKELDGVVNSEEERHRIETSQLKELLKEKERVVKMIEVEKKQLEHDLETVWRTTTGTIQDSLRGRQK